MRKLLIQVICASVFFYFNDHRCSTNSEQTVRKDEVDKIQCFSVVWGRTSRQGQLILTRSDEARLCFGRTQSLRATFFFLFSF